MDRSAKTAWEREVRTRLSSLRLSPTRESEIVEELAQHLDDRWRELIAGGVSAEEATQLTLAEFRDGNALARYMAPLRQSEKFDAAGYIRRWVPELAGLSDKEIHDPPERPDCYPGRIVEHAAARAEALAAMASLRAG